MLTRHSSRRRPLDTGFLTPRLAGARSYDRIAGYFSSSILEVAGEALESVEGKVRVVCNSQLACADVEVAKAAQAAMRREWCDSRPEDLGDGARPRFRRLYDFLRSGKVEVRVLPDDVFGLIHGKAGVITRADGARTAFLGSANESAAAFRLNYELVWEDDAPEAVAWVQEEFDALWSSPFAVPLADFVVRDLDRLSRRETIGDVAGWRDAPDPDPASVVVDAPVYRKEVGLWVHQKHFVKLAFDAHRGPHGARFVLADQVGLGKTLQLAMAAQLMALSGDGPVLILAPKPLLRQWQDEVDALLGLPTAVWDRGRWVDEDGIEHPGAGAESIRRCPRRVGIVSTGLVTGNAEAAAPEPLLRPPGVRARAAQQPPRVPPGDLAPHEEPAARDRHPGPAPSRRGLRPARRPRPGLTRGARVARQPLAQRRGIHRPAARQRTLRPPISTSAGNGCATPSRPAPKGGISRSCAARSPCLTRPRMRPGVRSMRCVRPTGSGSRAGSPASSSATTPTSAPSSCARANVSKTPSTPRRASRT